MTEVQAINEIIKKKNNKEMLGGGHLERNQLSLKRLGADGQTDFTTLSNLEFSPFLQNSPIHSPPFEVKKMSQRKYKADVASS